LEEIMRIRCLVLTLLAVPMFATAQGADPVAGAWEQISARNLTTSQSQPQEAPALHVIYAGGHYVQFRAAAKRAKIDTPRDKMTREQLLERGDMQGQYGSYRVTGNMLTRRVVSAANPNNEGRDVVFEFRIQGDTLTLLGTNAQGQRTEATFRRLR
jgi:hypothetical protein